MVTFAPQNVIMDPPFTKLDLLICRNLLIYLTNELQTKLLTLFHFSLNPGGFLFLGSAETIGNESNLFESLPGHQRLYRRKIFAAQRGPADFPSAFKPVPTATGVARETAAFQARASLQKQADRLLLQQFSPAAVLTNAQGDIAYISGRTGKYLEPAAGRAQWNLFAMAREGLHQELPILFQQVLRQTSPTAITQRGLRIKTNGDFQIVDLTLQALREPDALYGLILVVFADVAAPPRTRKRSNAADAALNDAALNSDVQQLREALQATREEMQTSQEELKSTNEEMQSTTEELQSANEELTTSKEEMQSLNEELQTVNAELQAKVDDLSIINNDMKNLLNSTEIATLFLDEALRIRRFTTQAAKLINLISGDVGRPITNIASDLIYSELAADVGEVLRTLVFMEKPIHTQDGRWFTARIMPYRTLDNRINGVVLTLTDITAFKVLEKELRQARDALNNRLTDKTNELTQLRTTLYNRQGQE